MENKSMNQAILYGVVGLLLGVVIAGYAANNNMGNMMQMMGMGRAHNMMSSAGDMSMGDMVQNLQGKTGDDFDKAFITGMIEHHEGAIDMANEAKKNAKHDEVKTMADDIISVQSREITQMKDWYKSWYGTDAPAASNDMMH